MISDKFKMGFYSSFEQDFEAHMFKAAQLQSGREHFLMVIDCTTR